MGDKKFHFSPSTLSMLSRCSMQYKLKQQFGNMPPGISMISGSAVHKSAELNLKSKANCGECLNVNIVKDAAVDYIEEAFKDEIAFTDEEKSLGKSKVKDTAIYSSIDMAILHYGAIAPLIMPKSPDMIERELYIDLEDKPYNLKMIIDVSDSDVIRDLKTSGKTPVAGIANMSNQLVMNSIGQELVDGKFTETAVLDYIVKTKKGAEHKPFVTIISQERKEKLFSRMDHYYKIVEGGAYTPCDPSSWCCSQRFCGWWHLCEFGGQ